MERRFMAQNHFFLETTKNEYIIYKTKMWALFHLHILYTVNIKHHSIEHLSIFHSFSQGWAQIIKYWVRKKNFLPSLFFSIFLSVVYVPNKKIIIFSSYSFPFPLQLNCFLYFFFLFVSCWKKKTGKEYRKYWINFFVLYLNSRL